MSLRRQWKMFKYLGPTPTWNILIVFPIPGSWLQPGPVPDAVGILGLNQ